MTVNIGEIIRTMRKESGLTQKGLADLAGIGKTTVFDLENGKTGVSFSNILKLCKVLNIRIITKDPFGNETELRHE